MAGLGSFIEGAMKGYAFADGMEGRKYRRGRREADDEWRDTARARQKTAWDRQDKEYNRAQNERSVLAAIGQEAQDTFDGQENALISASTRSEPEQDQPKVEGTEAAAGPVARPRSISQAYGDAAPQMPQDEQYRWPEGTAQPTNTPPDAMTRVPVHRTPDPWQGAYTNAPDGPTADQPPQRGPVSRGIGLPEPQDAAPAQPDGAPVQQGAGQFGQIAESLNLPPQAIEHARATDIAIAEAEAGRDMKTGAQLSGDEVSARIESADQTERQLRLMIQNAQPYDKGAAPTRPGGQGPRQAGVSDVLNDTRYRLDQMRHLLTPATQREADFGPVPQDNRASAATNAMNFGAPGQDAAPQAPAQMAAEPFPTREMQPVALVDMSLPARTPTADTAPAAPPSAPAQQTPLPRSVLGFGDTDQPASEPAQVAPDGQPQAAPQSPAEVSQAVMRDSQDQGATPAVVVAAAATAPKGVVGPDGQVKATETQRNRAAKSFLDHYAETAVPKIIEYYAKQGDLEKATAFETWAKDRKTQSLVKAYGKAVHAIALDDEEGGKRYLKEYYDQIDDGYEMLDFDLTEPDENGKATRAVVKLRNTETGEIIIDEFEDRADLITSGLDQIAPEKMFERIYAEIASASKAAAEQRKFERQVALEQVKVGLKGPAGSAKLVASAKKFLSETMEYGEWNKLTAEQQNQAAIEYVRSNQQAGQELNQPPAPAPYRGE